MENFKKYDVVTYKDPKIMWPFFIGVIVENATLWGQKMPDYFVVECDGMEIQMVHKNKLVKIGEL
jgi:hypothetical protein